MLYAIVVFLVLILDQAVKYWATVNLALNTGSIPLIPGVISLVNIHNYGAAFGFLQNLRWFFVIIAVIFVIVVIFALVKNILKGPLGRWSAVLVMAGAVGNAIDRVMNGYVVDMFQLQFVNFAIFNVADIFITVCGILFCVYIIFSIPGGEVKRRAETKTEKPGSGKKPLPAEKSPEDRRVRAQAPKAKPSQDRAVPPRPAAAAKPAAPAKPVGAGPFAEWESLPPLDGVRGAQGPVISAAVTSREAVSKAPPAAKPAKPQTEFSLEDILAEYSSK